MKKKRIFSLVLTIATALCCTNCSTSAPKDSGKDGDKLTARPLPFEKMQNVPKASLLDDSPLNIKEEAQEKGKTIADRKILVPQRTQSNRPKSTGNEYPSKLIKGITGADEELVFELNLDNAQIPELVAVFASPSVLNFNYMIDPSVKGAVTVNIKTSMKAKEIWNTFQHLLWLSGAYASPHNGFINILPFNKMTKEQRLFVKHDTQPFVDVLHIPIRYKKSTDVANIIKPYMTDGASVTDLADANALILVETPANSNKIQELIKLIDSKGEQEWPVRCFACHEVDSAQMVQELQGILPILGMPIAGTSGPSGGAIKITAIPRLNALVVSASMEEILTEVGNWIKLLDRSDKQDQEEIFFYNVKHSTVAKVSAALDAFFNTVTSTSPATTTSSSTSTSAGSLSTNSRNRSSRYNTTTNNNNRNTTNNRYGTNYNYSQNNRYYANNRNLQGNRTNNQGNGNANGTTTITHPTVFDTDVTVFTDDESNRMTIKTTPRTWKVIKAFLERQDIPPRQVSIRAVITSITLNKDTEFGISYTMRASKDSNLITGVLTSAGLITPDTTISSAMGDTTGLGLLFKGGGSNSPLAFVKATAGEGNTKILSEPHILVVSGSTAKVNVGQKIAIPTESTSYSSDDNMRTNYEYTDTGVIMEVTPYITAGNEVRMVISQEISAAEEQTDVNIPPVINTKTLTSELVVPDNSTLLMGGLIQNAKGESLTGVPWLMDIPYLGWLFRYNSYVNNRTELLVLITVNVIDVKSPQEELVRRYKASLEAIAEENKKANRY